ncbi:NAD(P)-binding protein [Seohaeicola saemankumensis]|uniref:NAD(P)-binding protein n=1 Tax=Seohaeicola saemankumensis TaxID=481181 RepID=UPI003AF3CF15
MGAGLSGPTCAYLLHAAGRQVAVIEASGHIASRTGPLTELHDHASHDGAAALFGFVGWPTSYARSGQTPPGDPRS